MRPRVAQDGGWPLKRSRRQPTEADRLLNVGRRYGNRLLHYQVGVERSVYVRRQSFLQTRWGQGDGA